DEVGDADHVDAGGPQVGVVGHRGQHHEAAVAAAVDGQPLRVALVVVAQPVAGVGQVVDAVHAPGGVVQVHVGGAEPGRAAHVGGQDGVAVLHEELEQGVEGGPRLALGPAVRVDDHRRQAPVPGSRGR